MIAANGWQFERNESIGGFTRKQTARANISKVDDQSDLPGGGIRKNSVKRSDVPVDVRNYSDLHCDVLAGQSNYRNPRTPTALMAAIDLVEQGTDRELAHQYRPLAKPSLILKADWQEAPQ
jgi:hypothetical protein